MSYKVLMTEEEMKERIKQNKNQDVVNHPKHYNMTGRKECIEEMIDIFGVEYVKAFCLLNVYKYKYRHALKNGQEDIDKANWYQRKYIMLGGLVEDIVRLEECFK